MIIYKATNKINGKSYIGQTIKPLERRISGHLYELKNGSDYYFHNALRKYDFENFSWEIICECSSKEEMTDKEKYYIKFFDTKAPS